MTRWKNGYSLTTNGEADYMQGEMPIVAEVFNLVSDETTEPKPMETAMPKRETAQMMLF